MDFGRGGSDGILVLRLRVGAALPVAAGGRRVVARIALKDEPLWLVRRCLFVVRARGFCAACSSSRRFHEVLWRSRRHWHSPHPAFWPRRPLYLGQCQCHCPASWAAWGRRCRCYYSLPPRCAVRRFSAPCRRWSDEPCCRYSTSRRRHSFRLPCRPWPTSPHLSPRATSRSCPACSASSSSPAAAAGFSVAVALATAAPSSGLFAFSTH